MATSSSHQEYSFAAGIMRLDEATKKVSADKRKGTVKISCAPSGEKPFTWTPEGSSEPEFEYMVTQGDAIFELSKQMKRVAVLRFECDSARYFFWLQNKDATLDAEIIQKTSAVIEFDVDNLMISEQPQIEQPRQAPAVAPQQTQPARNTNLIDANLFGQQFQQMFNNLSQQHQGGRNNYFSQLRDRRAETPNFHEVLTREALTELSNDPEAQNALIQHLPEGQQNLANLKENLQSPQFQQGLESLERAINSEEGAAVLISLGLDQSNFMQTLDGSDSFYKAILKSWRDSQSK